MADGADDAPPHRLLRALSRLVVALSEAGCEVGGYLPPGERAVRIELALPRERVLLLDFQSWHCVLGRSHLSVSWRESREWDRKTTGIGYQVPLPAPLEAELRASWQRVFDLDSLRRAKLWGPIDQIQGVTEYVLLEEVRGVDEFVAR